MLSLCTQQNKVSYNRHLEPALANKLQLLLWTYKVIKSTIQVWHLWHLCLSLFGILSVFWNTLVETLRKHLNYCCHRLQEQLDGWMNICMARYQNYPLPLLSKQVYFLWCWICIMENELQTYKEPNPPFETVKASRNTLAEQE